MMQAASNNQHEVVPYTITVAYMERLRQVCLHAGNEIVDADASFWLEDTGRVYKGGKFPHLQGCRVLTMPNMPLEQVTS